uniref:retinol dehydrogenase 8-like n=1 Tax=Lonchura striata TaxID=40157 RepID=UPI00129377CE|nr:retinol dehydrogenase 8-like [Lonchura striata domestica]
MATPRTVLVTGCSSGIGLALAVLLARDPQRRYLVLATMRDLARRGPLEAAAGAAVGDTLRLLPLDVTSDASVAECLRQVPGGRVDVVGVAFNDVYAASKFAVEGLCESLAVQLLHFNVFVSLVEPGPVHTEFERKLLREVEKSEFPGADAETLRCFREVFLPASRQVFDTFGQTPEEVAQAIAGVIAAPRPPFRTPTNALYSPLLALRFADPRGDLGVRSFHRLLFDLAAASHSLPRRSRKRAEGTDRKWRKGQAGSG